MIGLRFIKKTFSPRSSIGSIRFISDALKNELNDIVKSKDVVVFMKGHKDAPQCGFSRAVVQVLQLQGLQEFSTINVLENDELRQGIKEFSSWPTIPQVYVKGEFVGGCDIMINMFQSGELATMLTEKGVSFVEPKAEETKE